MLNEDLQGLLNKALFYLKFRPRTVGETRRYLYKKIKTTHWSQQGADSVIDHLLELDFLNDEKFIDWFVSQRISAKPKGEYFLKAELKKYGVEKETINKYFEVHPIDEEVLAEKALAGRWDRFKNLPKKICFQKACQFLGRRGFGFSTSKKIIAKFTNKE